MITALIIIGSLIVLIVLFGFLSPRYARLHRSIEIKASPEVIWEQMIDLKNFVGNWSPWSKLDPNMKQEFSGSEKGLGARYFWSGDPKKVGEGTMEIIEVKEGKKVDTKIAFKGRGTAIACFILEDNGSGTCTVTWDFESDNGMNPIARIFGRMMEKFIGPDYEKGLRSLKDHCEK